MSGGLLFGQEASSLPLGSPFITNYASEFYSVAGKNWDIGQGEDGKMYFANNYGLVEFNGYDWQRIGQPLNQSELRSFALTAERIYIGGTSEIGYFDRNSRGQLNYHILNDLILDTAFAFNDVRAICTYQERVFFLTDQGIMMYKEQSDSISLLGRGIPFRAWSSGRDEIVFAANEAGIYRFQNDDLVLLSDYQTYPNLHVEFIQSIRPGTYLIGTDKSGVLIFEQGKIRIWNPLNQEHFKQIYLNRAIILNKDQIIFGSLHEGLLVTDYQGNIHYKITEKDGLPDHSILSLYKDHQGNIWTAMDEEVSYLELNSPFTLVNKKNGLRGEVYSILTKDKYLYVGTSRGLFISPWSDKRSKQPQFKLIPNTTGQCWQIIEHQGNILLANHNGVFQIKEDKAIFIGGEGHWNFAIHPSRPNLLLSGHYRGVRLIGLQNGNYQILKDIEGFEETSRELRFDNDEVWVSHGYKGIYRLELSKDLSRFSTVERYDTASGLPSNSYNNLIVTPDGILFGTQNGVYQYDAETNTMVPEPVFGEILGTETLIRKLYPVGNGSFLAIKNYYGADEVAMIDLLEDGSYTQRENPFQKLRGQLIPAFESVSFPTPSLILIGSRRGMLILNTDFRSTGTQEHDCFVNEVNLPLRQKTVFESGAGIASSRRITIPTRENELLEFTVSSSFFEAIPYMQYSTYLEGYDDDWQAWTNSHQRQFVGLPAGDYTFWAKSRNIYDVEAESTPINFAIEMQDRSISGLVIWGIALIIVLLGLLLYFFVNSSYQRPMIRQLSSEKQSLNHTVQTLEAQQEEWQVERENASKTLSDALLKTEMQKVFIKKIEQLAHQKADMKEVQKAVQQYENSSKGIQLQLDTQQLVEKDDFLVKIKENYPDLSARELRLCSYLKLNVSSKEIAEYMGISIRGVESLRYRVRKKLGLDTGQDLTEFILGL
ncbi:MAG: hypothetical protein KTR30_02645 [Saprospiraceae bacterium]|nr:hypothetical protein [Saprospiraceae bacterium]